MSIELDIEPNQTLLVVVKGHETEFETQLVTPFDNVPAATRIAYARLVPHYQRVSPSEMGYTLAIQVSPVYATKNASVEVSVSSLAMVSDADHRLVDAYRLYASATESTNSEDEALWTKRIEEMNQAATAFEDLGFREQSLWAQSLVAYFSYFFVFDNATAKSVSSRVSDEAAQEQLVEIQLMNLETLGQVLIEPNRDDSLPETIRKQEQAQVVFEQASDIASRISQDYERSWITNLRGIGFFYLDKPAEAISFYEMALEQAIALQDAIWVNMVVGNLALAHEKTGDFETAVSSLKQVNDFLRTSQSSGELVINLTELGRIYRRLYMFPQSIEMLSEALEGARSEHDRDAQGRILTWLAGAYYSMGFFDRANEYLGDSIALNEQTKNSRYLLISHQLMATIARLNGDYEQMSSHREKQKEYLNSDLTHATYYYDLGMDELSLGDDHKSIAHQHFAEAYRRNIELKNQRKSGLAYLRMCATTSASAEDELCVLEKLKKSYSEQITNAFPQQKFEAMSVWATILAEKAEDGEAIEVYEQLIEELAFYRRVLPGVLGAWYWESRNEIFNSYISLLIDRDFASGNGVDSLLALNSLRYLAAGRNVAHTPGDDWSSSDNASELRRLLAYRDRERDTDKSEDLGRDIDRLLISEQRARSETSSLSRQEFLEGLHKLKANTALLSYHFTESGSWLWHASSAGVRLYPLGADAGLTAKLDATRDNFRVVGYEGLISDLDVLGNELLDVVYEQLPPRIYLLPGGALNGFPFDTLRVKGKFLAENHIVTNLMSLQGIGSLSTSTDFGSVKSIFLAGNPLLENLETPALQASGIELQMIANTFSDKDIYRAEGMELTIEAFQSAAFSNADLIHIASHARVDLDYPELSRLSLSSYGRTEKFITPRDFEETRLSASLAVLSACETVGSNQFSFDSNLGFVSSLANSGVKLTLATMWPIADRQSQEFLNDFYIAGNSGIEFEQALQQAKLKHMNALNHNNISSWSAYQLFRSD